MLNNEETSFLHCKRFIDTSFLLIIRYIKAYNKFLFQCKISPALSLASGAGSSLSLSLFTARNLPAQPEGQSSYTQIPDCAALLFGRGPVCEAVKMKHSSMGLRMEVTQPQLYPHFRQTL